MKKVRVALPALGSKERKVLLFSSAVLFALWGTGYFVQVVRAQGKGPALAIPVVAIVSPKGGDARKGIPYDPFYDSVDPAAPDASSLIGDTKSSGSMSFTYPKGSVNQMPGLTMGGDGIGVPDVAFGQPILMPGSGNTSAQGGSASPAPGAPSVTPDVVSYAGRITGNPPIAVLRWSSGASRVVHFHEMTSAGRIVLITADAVKFANGLTLPFNPTPVSASSPAPVMPQPSPTPIAPTFQVQAASTPTPPLSTFGGSLPAGGSGMPSSGFPSNPMTGKPLRTPPPSSLQPLQFQAQSSSGGQP